MNDTETFDDDFDLSNANILNFRNTGYQDISRIKNQGEMYKGETIRGMTHVMPFVEMPFSNRTSAQVEQFYFPDAKKIYEDTIKVVNDVGCNCGLPETARLKINFVGETKTYEIILFVSKNGIKVKETYECTKPKTGEILLFIEQLGDNEASKQRIYAKIDPEFQQAIKNTKVWYKQSVVDFLNQNSTIDSALVFELIRHGKIEDKLSTSDNLVDGLFKMTQFLTLSSKAIGWVLGEVGDVIDYLKIPDKIWDSTSNDFFLKKENVIESLSLPINDINIRLENIKQLIINQPNMIWLNEISDQYVENRIDEVKQKVIILCLKYNTFIEKKINELYKVTDSENIAFAVQQSELDRTIALIAGIWNGLVDFVSGLFKIVGFLLRAPHDMSKHREDLLEHYDNIRDLLDEIDMDLLMQDLSAAIKKYLYLEDSDDINYVRLYYVGGYTIAFVGTMFIPLTQLVKIGKVSKVQTALQKTIGEGIESLQKNNKFVPDNSATGIRASLKMVTEMLENLKPSPNRQKFFEQIAKDFRDWFLKNKERFGKFANRTGIYAQKYVGRKLQPLINSSTAFFKYGDAGRKVVKAVDENVAKIVSSLSKKQYEKVVMVSGMIFKQGGKTSKAFARTNFTKTEIGNLAKNNKYLDDLGKPSVYQKFLDDMHPILQKRFEKHLEEMAKGLNATADDIARAGKPGSHGEIRALDDLLKSIDPNGIKYGDDVFKYIYGYNRFLRNGANTVQPPCAHCHFITHFVTYIGL